MSTNDIHKGFIFTNAWMGGYITDRHRNINNKKSMKTGITFQMRNLVVVSSV